MFRGRLDGSGIGEYGDHRLCPAVRDGSDPYRPGRGRRQHPRSAWLRQLVEGQPQVRLEIFKQWFAPAFEHAPKAQQFPRRALKPGNQGSAAYAQNDDASRGDARTARPSWDSLGTKYAANAGRGMMSHALVLAGCLFIGDSITLAPALVVNTIVQRSEALVRVQTQNGQVVSTPDHAFALARDRVGWARADHLAAGDSLVRLSPGGAPTEVVSVEEISGRPVPVFNLVVARVHAYLVGTEHLLVHNGKCKTPEEAAAERQQLDDLIAERGRLTKEGDPEHKLVEIRNQIKRLGSRIRAARMWDRIRADPVRREAKASKDREKVALRRAQYPGKDAAQKKARFWRDAEFRERERQRLSLYRQELRKRAREHESSERRQSIIASLARELDGEETAQGVEGIPKEAIDARVRELADLFRGSAESPERGEGELRPAVEEDLSEIGREVESGAGVEVGATSTLEGDLALEDSTFSGALADVRGRIDEFDSMSEEVAALLSGVRDELVAQYRNLVNLRSGQIQLELEATSRQLELMKDAPGFHGGEAERMLEHQLQTLNAELGSLPGASP